VATELPPKPPVPVKPPNEALLLIGPPSKPPLPTEKLPVETKLPALPPADTEPPPVVTELPPLPTEPLPS